MGDVLFPLAFVSAAAASAALTPLLARVASRMGIVSPPRADRWGARPTPLLGGIAIVAAVVVPTLVLAGAQRFTLVILGGAIASLLLGLVDDVRGLRPTSKLVGQTVIASGLVIAGVRVEITEIPPLAFVLSLLWVVGVMNAMNLVDNMDGLAGGIAAIAAAVLVFMVPADLAWIGVVAAAVAGGCIGFLIHNFAPARVYMGDAGSLSLGFLLAAISLLLTNAAAANIGLAILGPLLVLGLPIFDTALVAITRRLEGRSVTQGGRDHTSHRLAAMGLDERSTVLALYGVAAGFALLGLLAPAIGLPIAPLLVLAVVGMVLFGVFLAESPRAPEEETPTPRSELLGAGRRLVRFGGEIALDVVLATTALFSAYLIRFEALRPEVWMYLFVQAAPILVPVQLASFVLLGVYRTLWRFLSLTDVLSIFRAILVSTLIAAVLMLGPLRFNDQSRAVFLIDAVLLSVFLIGSRSSLLWLRHWTSLRPRANGRRVLIVGASEMGELALRLLLQSRDVAYQPIGFLDDDPGKLRRRIAGVPVLGTTAEVERIAGRESVDLVILAVEDRAGAARIRESCARSGIEMREFVRPL